MEDLMNLDLYELVGTVSTATVKEIKTAYRKKALTCHPDKNPDNPRAAELFQELSRALEILIDDSARAAYDKVLNARKQAKIRASQLSAKRRKLTEDLEAREEAYKRSLTEKTAEQKLKAEIERLKKEGSRQVEEEKEAVLRNIREQLHGKRTEDLESVGGTVKLKWKAAKDDPENGGYNHDEIHRLLYKYGDIEAIIVSTKKKGQAVVEFKKKSAAITAVQLEIGHPKNPLTLQGLWEDKEKPKATTTSQTSRTNFSGLFASGLFSSTDSKSKNSNTFPSFSSAPKMSEVPRNMTDSEFENSVLKRLRQAEERKKLVEQLQEEEKK